MKFNQVVKSAVLGLAVLLATSAFAGTNKGSLHLAEAAQVNGQALPAGDYKLQWEGTGANVEVSFLQGKKVITKSSARVIDLTSTPNNDMAVIDKAGSTPAVTEVRFAGKKQALSLSGNEKAGMGESTK